MDKNLPKKSIYAQQHMQRLARMNEHELDYALTHQKEHTNQESSMLEIGVWVYLSKKMNWLYSAVKELEQELASGVQKEEVSITLEFKAFSESDDCQREYAATFAFDEIGPVWDKPVYLSICAGGYIEYEHEFTGMQEVLDFFDRKKQVEKIAER